MNTGLRGSFVLFSREVKFALNLSIVSFLTFLGFNLVSPILPKYALSFNVSIALTGWAISAFAVARVITDVGAVLGPILATYISEAFNPTRVTEFHLSPWLRSP